MIGISGVGVTDRGCTHVGVVLVITVIEQRDVGVQTAAAGDMGGAGGLGGTSPFHAGRAVDRNTGGCFGDGVVVAVPL